MARPPSPPTVRKPCSECRRMDAEYKPYWHNTRGNWYYHGICHQCYRERRNSERRVGQRKEASIENLVAKASPFSQCTTCVFRETCRYDTNTLRRAPWCTPDTPLNRVFVERYGDGMPSSYLWPTPTAGD